MNELVVARRIVPELIEVFQARARILQRIRLMQPIGRRALAVEMDTTERILRSEVDFLRQQGLLISAPAGMSLTEEGQALLQDADQVLASIEGRTELAATLSKRLGVPTVIVVAGDSDESPWVKDVLGYHAATTLREMLQADDVVAVTGGSTMASLAKMMPGRGESLAVKVVPARGGLGETLSVQANTIASELATQLGGTSIMLHVPDRIAKETLQLLINEPHIKERLTQIREATVVVHGIGDAMRMARRRQVTEEEKNLLQAEGAVAEAFGYYFNASGQTVYNMSIVGLGLDDLTHVRIVMAVAGGHSKADAIAAATKAYRLDCLVTDEGAARKILQTNHGGELS